MTALGWAQVAHRDNSIIWVPTTETHLGDSGTSTYPKIEPYGLSVYASYCIFNFLSLQKSENTIFLFKKKK